MQADELTARLAFVVQQNVGDVGSDKDSAARPLYDRDHMESDLAGAPNWVRSATLEVHGQHRVHRKTCVLGQRPCNERACSIQRPDELVAFRVTKDEVQISGETKWPDTPNEETRVSGSKKRTVVAEVVAEDGLELDVVGELVEHVAERARRQLVEARQQVDEPGRDQDASQEQRQQLHRREAQSVFADGLKTGRSR